MAHGAEAARATASCRPVISCVRPPGRYDSNDWNLARRSLPRAVRATPHLISQICIPSPSPCERKSKGSPRLQTTPQRHRLDRTRTAAQERGQKNKLELPLPPGSRIQITCSTNADSDASNPRPRDARRRRLDGGDEVHLLGRPHQAEHGRHVVSLRGVASDPRTKQ